MAKASGGPPPRNEDLKLPATGIRADVLQAAHKVWPQFRRRAVVVLGTLKRAARLMEAAALSLSCTLDRQKQVPPVKKQIAALLKANLDLALPLGKESSKKKRVAEWKNAHAGVANATAGDFAALFPKLDDQTSMIIAMRSWGHNWKEIAAMLGTTSAKARSLLRSTMHPVPLKRSDRKRRSTEKKFRGK